MNYLRVHAAARRKVHARRDILGLLKNAGSRCSKVKNKQVFPTKKYGIFAKALSFKVLLQENDENVDESLQKNPEKIIVVPIKHDQSVRCPVSGSVNKKSLKKIRGHKPNLIKSSKQSDLMFKRDASKKPCDKNSLLPEIVDHRNTLCLLETAASNENETAQSDRIIEKPMFSNEFVDYNSGFRSPSSAGFEFKMQSDDALHKPLSIESNIMPHMQQNMHDFSNSSHSSYSIGSIRFNSAENQSEASAYNGLFRLSSTESEPDKNSDEQLNHPGLSFNTLDFTQQTYSSLEFSNQYEFTRSTFNELTDEIANLPQLTMEMVIERKSQAARLAYDQLFSIPELIQSQLNLFIVRPAINFAATEAIDSSTKTDAFTSTSSTFNQVNKQRGLVRLKKQQKRLAARQSMERLLRGRYVKKN